MAKTDKSPKSPKSPKTDKPRKVKPPKLRKLTRKELTREVSALRAELEALTTELYQTMSELNDLRAAFLEHLSRTTPTTDPSRTTDPEQVLEESLAEAGA